MAVAEGRERAKSLSEEIKLLYSRSNTTETACITSDHSDLGTLLSSKGDDGVDSRDNHAMVSREITPKEVNEDDDGAEPEKSDVPSQMDVKKGISVEQNSNLAHHFTTMILFGLLICQLLGAERTGSFLVLFLLVSAGMFLFLIPNSHRLALEKCVTQSGSTDERDQADVTGLEVE